VIEMMLCCAAEATSPSGNTASSQHQTCRDICEPTFFFAVFDYRIRMRIYSETSFGFSWQIKMPFSSSLNSVIHGKQTAVTS